MSTTAKTSRRETVTDTAAFRLWLQKAKPGDRAIYHVGMLMADRQRVEAVDELGSLAWWAYEEGRVFLLQQKVPGVFGTYLYIAQRRYEI